MRNRSITLTLLAAAIALAVPPAGASSHREAPAILRTPQVDATDFYIFRSYEPGREDFVTLIANYIPLQDPYGGPNYFPLDPDASYRIHIDNSGDGKPDLTFDFRVTNTLRDIQLKVGDESVSIPLRNIGQITSDPASQDNLNVLESYTVRLTHRGGANGLLRDVDSGSTRLGKPMDNIGRKSFPDYASYAEQFIHRVEIPGCANGRVFVGQRKDSFVVNLGEIFDLVNLRHPVGGQNAESDDLADKNITSLVLEVPTACLTDGDTDIIGAWTTAHLPRRRTVRNNPSFERPEDTSGGLPQVSRLGMPLVNELVIGLKDKNRFNASSPANDGRFATYVTNPTLPEILEILFGVEAPNNFPRLDLLATFITGIPGLNEFGFGEMQRLNVTIPPTRKARQERLGVIAGDNAGFPNGRRPGDDVVDVELRVVMGLLCHAFPGLLCDPTDAPSGTLPFTDGARQSARQFAEAFPYLRPPIPGSPN
ncbi:MAG: DUF4331 domain-containing protein [Acidobacteria bacterium]|nr:DUF4331 domain-containing protein [Acidobacteriota bacterium]